MARGNRFSELDTSEESPTMGDAQAGAAQAEAGLETTTAATLAIDSGSERDAPASPDPDFAPVVPGAAQDEGATASLDPPAGSLPPAQNAGTPDAAAVPPAQDNGSALPHAAPQAPAMPATASQPVAVPPTPMRPLVTRKHPGTRSDDLTLEERQANRRRAINAQVRATLADDLAEIAAQPTRDDGSAEAAGKPRRHSPGIVDQFYEHSQEDLANKLLEKDDATFACISQTLLDDNDPDALEGDPGSPIIAMQQQRAFLAAAAARSAAATRSAAAARTAAGITARVLSRPVAPPGPPGLGNAPDDPMTVSDDEAPAAPPALPPRGTGIVLPGATTLSEEDRATARAVHPLLEAATTPVDAAGDSTPIDGMPANGHVRGAEPLQARDFAAKAVNSVVMYVTILSLGNNFDVANIAPAAAAAGLISALKYMLAPLIPDFAIKAAPVIADAAKPGVLRPLTFLLYDLVPLALEILTSHRFWIVNGTRFIAYSFSEPASNFIYTLQGLLTEDPDRVVELLRAKWGEPGGAVQAFLLRHHARIPAGFLARLLNGIRAEKMVTFLPRSNKLEVIHFNIFSPLDDLPSDLHRQLRITLSNISVRDSFLGTSSYVSPPWFCKTCRASSHPTGLCESHRIRNWKPEEQQPEELDADHLLFGEERASRGRGGARGGRGRGGRGNRGRGRGAF